MSVPVVLLFRAEAWRVWWCARRLWAFGETGSGLVVVKLVQPVRRGHWRPTIHHGKRRLGMVGVL